MKNNLVLVGFMGAGKSLVANILSKALKKRRISTDEMIEKHTGKKIPVIFSELGESSFRQIEKEMVKKLASKENVVIDCGGGVILDPANIKILKQRGLLFYLETSPEVVLKRLKDQRNRPLLQVADPLAKIRELMAQRKNLYEQADIKISTDGQTVKQTAQAILDCLHKLDVKGAKPQIK